MSRLKLAIAWMLALTAALALSCGGGNGASEDLFATLPVYQGATEVDRHSEERNLAAAEATAEPGRALFVQYATADDKASVQKFFGERLLRLGFRPDTRLDPGRPKDTLQFVDDTEREVIAISFSDRQVTWDPALSPQAGSAPPADARTFFVVAVQAP